MGRIADALARAQTQRCPIDAGAPPTPDATSKWSNWYGMARTAPALTQTHVESKPLGTPVPGMTEQIVTYYDRSSLIAEQYRSLRTRLLSANPHHERRVYAITSALPKDGKSVTTVNLGFSFAEIRHFKVLLVDCDFRHSSLAGMLNVDPSPGLGEFLRERASYEDIIKPTVVSNLFLVTAGKTGGRSAPELLSTRAARTVFKRFEKDFNYTIVDTPPAATVTDAGIVGQMTAGVIFLVRMHRTHEPLAKRAIKHLVGNNVSIVGGVLIAEDDRSSGYGNRYKYDRYYYSGPSS